LARAKVLAPMRISAHEWDILRTGRKDWYQCYLYFPTFQSRLDFWIGKTMARRWTDQEIEKLKRMARLYPAHRIAEMTNRTLGGIVFKAQELSIALRPRSQTSDQMSGADPGVAGFGWP